MITAVVPSLKPRVHTAVIRAVYSCLSVGLRKDDTSFLNYGFMPPDGGETALSLAPADERDRYSIQLYARVVHEADLREKQVLEVGCGRGGGASFLTRYFHPAAYTGIDLSGRAVEHCRRAHRIDRLDFRQGDASNLPLANQSVDVVVNVESAHCYPSLEAFFDEVKRVLRPGGRFLFADMRGADGLPDLRLLLSDRFTIAEEEIITPGVLRALELDTDRRNHFIQSRAPKFMQSAFQALAGVNGSATFDLFSSRKVEYVRFVCIRD